MTNNSWSAKVGSFMNDKMNIGGQKIPIKRGELMQSDLKYWPLNPRIYSIVHASEDQLDQDEIQLELQKRDHVKELIRDIKHHGGLIDPIVVLDKKLFVIEGNSRLAAIRFLAPKGLKKFSKIPCVILPATVEEKQIYSYLNQQHIKGKSQWSPYEQAGVVYRLVGAGWDFKVLSEELNISTRKAKSMYETYKFMVDNDEDCPTRYSYYHVYLSTRLARKQREKDPRMDKRIVREVRDGSVTAQEFRKMLPAVCDNRRQLGRFLSGKASIEGSYEQLEAQGKNEDLVKSLRRIHEQSKHFKKTSFDKLGAKAQKDAEYHLSRIISTLSTLKKKVYD